MADNPLVTKILQKDQEKAEKAFQAPDNGPESFSEHVGQRLRMAMAFRDMGSKELSQRCRVPRQTVWRYRKGEVGQQFEPLVAMAKVLNVSLDYLAFGGEIRERTK
jgi:ribosome-binding protein aMBF1 (putative translation factor)